MMLVPKDDTMPAEVWVGNDDIGFVKPGQEVKLQAFQFQKYGMVQGTLAQVSADAAEAPSPNTRSDALSGCETNTQVLARRTVSSRTRNRFI